jgi:hypothetical protein
MKKSAAKAQQPNSVPVERALAETYRLIHFEALSVAVTLGFKPGKGMASAIKRESAAFDREWSTVTDEKACARGRCVGSRASAALADQRYVEQRARIPS